jgi:hypothetical protein
MNRLDFGDNLIWLRNTKEFPDASLDPPFAFSRNNEIATAAVNW